MEEDLRTLSCSKCGCETVRMRAGIFRVITECTECGSTSELVVVVEPKIEFRFGKGSEGALKNGKDGQP